MNNIPIFAQNYNMKTKNYLPIILIIIIVVVIAFITLLFKNQSTNTENNTSLDNYTNSSSNEPYNIPSDQEIKNVIDEKSSKATEPVERELSSFTTNLSFSSEGRLKNIEITSGKLNGTIVNPGQEFSFNDTTRSFSSRGRL